MTTYLQTEPAYPPLADALARWVRADEAFARGCSRSERGAATLDELEARGAVHHLSEIESSFEHPLRAKMVEEGVRSPSEALDRLDALDFTMRANALRALLPILPDEQLGRTRDMVTRPGWTDDERWEVDEGLIQSLSARAAHAGECAPEGASAPGVASNPANPPMTTDAAADVLASFLFGERATGRDLWSDPWRIGMLSYLERVHEVDHDGRWRQAFALVAEMSRDRASPQSAVLRRALLDSGHELWAEPWFDSVLDDEERREHLRRVLAHRESRSLPLSDRFEGLLDVAERLQGARRATALRWAVALREKGRSADRTFDLARVAALAEGHDRTELLGKIEFQLDGIDAKERILALVTLMTGATPAETMQLARCGLEVVASGETPIQYTTEFLATIPPRVWTNLGRADWEPALAAGSRARGWSGNLRWIPYDPALLDVPNLPEEARRLIEERGLPVLLGADADDRLRVAAMSLHALSADGRAQLAASVLALDAAAWREESYAVAPIARCLTDDELERLCHTLHDPDPKGKWGAEQGLAEAWAARGALDGHRRAHPRRR
jgi:hypothetical protein